MNPPVTAKEALAVRYDYIDPIQAESELAVLRNHLTRFNDEHFFFLPLVPDFGPAESAICAPNLI